MIDIAFSDKYIYELPEGHRFPIRKYALIAKDLLAKNLVQPQHFFDPGMADKEILLAHDPSYYKKVLDLALSTTEIRTLGVPLHKASVARALNSVAGTLRSAVNATRNSPGITIGGGYHHAYADHGEGFCIFNDLAISARYLLKEGLAKKVLIIDLDVHQGNGTAHILDQDEDIFTFSMHGMKNYPARKERSSMDVELPDGTNDRHYLNTLERALDVVLQKFNPDIILYQAGVDVLSTDQLGRLELSIEGCKKRDEFIFTISDQIEVPVAITLGGGYSRNIDTIVQAHVNTITSAFEILS